MFTRTTLSIAFLTVSSVVQAAVPGEVIAAYERQTGWAVMSPDGSNLGHLNCGGNLSQRGAPRFFLSNLPGATFQLADGSTVWTSELTATDEDCRQSVVLSNEGDKRFSMGRWSPDGNTIAVYAEAYDLVAGTLDLDRTGTYLADVLYTGDRPMSVTNIRLVLPGNSVDDWSPDSGQLVYTAAGTDGYDLFVYTLATGISVNITRTPGRSEGGATWSSTGRIAYQRVTSTSRSGDRIDIYSIPATGGAELQLTSKTTTGAPMNIGASYSPDGQFLAICSGTQYGNGVSLGGEMALYRIRADGTGKPVKIVGGKGQDWRYHIWRR